MGSDQGGLVGNVIGSELYTSLGFNGALLVLFSLLAIVAVYVTDFKVSDLILAAEDSTKEIIVFTKDKLLKSFVFTKNLLLKLLSKNNFFKKALVTKENIQKQIEVFSCELEMMAVNSNAATSEEIPLVSEDSILAVEEEEAVVAHEKPTPKKKQVKHKLRIAVDNTNPNIVIEDLEDSSEEKLVEKEVSVSKWSKTYNFPKASFLSKSKDTKHKSSASQQKAQSKLVEDCLAGFGLKGNVVAAHCGDRLSMFEFEPEAGVKISKIQSLTNDLALSLGAPSIRILAPIPGKNTIGIEIPNESYGTLSLGNLIEASLKNKSAVLPFAMGKNVYNEVVVADLNAMPHLLVSGTTGSGKSVFMNCLITSLLYNKSPKDLRFLMIDPKMIELTPYNGIPHLLKPVICDVDESKDALVWAEHEMDRRYQAFADVGARNIDTYNKKIKTVSKKSLERKLSKKIEEPEHMPYIVIVIDELADLMITQGKEVEKPITRIAQKARACGIHLILATQRPSAEIVTGLIKTNFPSRIAFKVSSSIDSRTILDTSGAERLLGQGDMLYLPNGKHIERLQGAFVSEDEVSKIVKYISE
ncbi:MAG: DNA translocase FtsK 4TM domain-containing protein [Bdellovibrionota bacterium]